MIIESRKGKIERRKNVGDIMSPGPPPFTSHPDKTVFAHDRSHEVRGTAVVSYAYKLFRR
jgi:hypothetical protein